MQMPCGKEDCTGCKTCIFDKPIDAPLLQLKKRKEMTRFGIVPFDGNPSTAQIVIPGTRRQCGPFMAGGVEPVQLNLQFNENAKDKKDLYCNRCEHFVCIARPGKNRFNTRCSADTVRPGGAYKVIKLNVFPDENVKKPFWCPIIKNAITNPFNPSEGIKIGGKTIYPARNESAMSDEQLAQWNKSKAEKERKEKWLAMSGLTAWKDIKLGKIYHLPPTIKKKRMDLVVKSVNINSIYCEDIKTGNNVWLYKDDEEYKFMSPVV